ncbi:NAD(P)-binding protein [Acephala macrosclerotiorum]|nr:NAD(P)-binding protein [Acephala macrosclerotiorum]
MALNLKGKTALVIGDGSGICLEFTEFLLENGCNVLIADLTLRPEAEEVVNTPRGKAKAIFVKTDITGWSQLQVTFDTAIKHFGALDIVCPGAGVFGPLGHGVILIVSSTAGQSDILGAPMYAASKHAMNRFTRSPAELEPKSNIRVNAVPPGCVKTPLWTNDKLA